MKVSGQKQFILFSDSKSCLQALCQYGPDNPLIQELRELYAAIVESGKEVVICWLPSHIGIEGNEEADQAAKAGLKRQPGTCRIPTTDLLGICKEKAKLDWQSQWNSEKNNKLHAIEPSVGKRVDHKKMTRRESTRMVRLRIGHSLMTHGYLMVAQDPPICQRCQVTLTMKHLVLYCRKTKQSREKYLKGCKSMQSVLQGTESKKILSFLRETKIFDRL